MIEDIVVIRRKRRRTHLSLDAYNAFSITAVCGQPIRYPLRSGDIVRTDLAGGATDRLIAFLRHAFNDDTCCKRCTAAAAVIVALYRSRDKGLRAWA